MNSIFNNFLQKFIPYIYAGLFAYILSSIVFVSLPKSGVDFVEKSTSNLSYKKYDGFYSKLETINIVNEKKKTNKKNIETLTKYQLKAVYSTISNGGWIIVEEKSSNKSKILEQLDKLDDYTLVKLFKNYVIFEKDQKEYKLELPKEKDVNYKVQRKSNNIKENIIVNEDSVSVNRNYLNSYVNDLDKVWKDIAINDIRKNGVIEGFKVNRVNADSVFGKLGLKQNDIIKSVNGNKIKSYADAFKIYNEINNLDYLSLEVLRNNEIVELNYEID